MYKLRLGKSIALKSGEFYELVKEAVALGFESIDVCMCAGGFWFDEAEIKETRERLAFVKSTGLYFNAIHIPYGDQWDISRKDEAERQVSMENIRKLVEITKEFSPFTYILHSSFEPIMDEDRDVKLAALIKSVKELRSLGVTIAIENLPRTCLMNTATEILSVIEAVGGMPICIDVNHFLRDITHKAVAAISKYAIATHISDHDYVNERHWLPEKGKIDFMQTIAALERAGYQGSFTYELEAPLAEIKQNYEELFERYNARKC